MASAKTIPTIRDTLDEVDQFVAGHRHSERSFVKSVLAGEADRPALRRWAIQKYHQVYEQNRVFSQNHAGSRHEEIRLFMVDQLISEETSIQDGSAAHYVLMERFALALGATKEEILQTAPAAEVMRFVNFLLDLSKADPLECMLAQYINESQTPAAAQALYRYLKDAFGFSDADLEWFTVHGEADIEHASRGRKLIEKYAEQDLVDRAIDIARSGCDEWLKLHEYYATLI